VSATRPIQEAFYGVLSADATLAALSLTEGVTTVSVLNDALPGQSYPYVMLSRATETPRHVMGGPSTGLGWKNIIRVHVYSRYDGDRECLRIWERCVALLNFATLTVTGFGSVHSEVESMRVLVEDIEKVETRHLVGEFNVTVQQ
jgi:hypothetical protein